MKILILYILFFITLPSMVQADTLVMFVNSLADSGKGSLRECAERPETRQCLFSSKLNSGVINLKNPLTIRFPNLIIDGESAPYLIELRGAGIRVQASDVTIRHIAVRPGAVYPKNSKTYDGVVIWSLGKLERVVLDHLLVDFAVDENISSYGSNIKDITISNSIIAEGLWHSVHPDGPHSKGIMLSAGNKNVYIFNNLIASNQDRNPRLKSGCSLSFYNNIVYNYGGTTSWNALNFSEKISLPGTFVDVVENIYKKGPDSPTKNLPIIYWDKNIPKNSKVFVLNNIAPTRPQNNLDQWLVSALPKSMQSIKPLLETKEKILVEDLEQYITRNVGPRPLNRDATSSRMVREMLTGTGQIPDCVKGCLRSAGGWD